jgi:hypothetical protein
MWWCGDEECDCTQPQIIEHSTEVWREPEWKPPTIVESGPFITDTGAYTLDERQEQICWLLQKAAEYQVPNLAEIQKDWSQFLLEEP